MKQPVISPAQWILVVNCQMITPLCWACFLLLLSVACCGAGRFTRADLMDYKVKELRQFLMRRNVAISNCTEKADLVEALLRFNNSSQYRLEQDENNRRMQHLQVLYQIV